MRIVISNIPDGADLDYVLDCLRRNMSGEIEFQQLPE